MWTLQYVPWCHHGGGMSQMSQGTWARQEDLWPLKVSEAWGRVLIYPGKFCDLWAEKSNCMCIKTNLFFCYCVALPGQPLVEGRLLCAVSFTGDGFCPWLCLSSYQAYTVLYKHSSRMNSLTILSPCHGLGNVSQILGLFWSVCVCVQCCVDAGDLIYQFLLSHVLN